MEELNKKPASKLWGFLCQHCSLHSGEAYRGENPEDYAPSCCSGKPMTPYEIPRTISKGKGGKYDRQAKVGSSTKETLQD